MIGCVFLPNTSLVASHRVCLRYSLLGIISARFLLNLRMLKSEDQEYKSQQLTANPACASDRDAVGYRLSFGILTGVEGLVDQFELDDTRKGGDIQIAMQTTA